MTCTPTARRPAAPADAVREPSDVPARRPGVRSELLDRLRRDDVLAQFTRFVLVGGLSSSFYTLLFWALHGLGSRPANVVAVVLSSIVANDLHRRLTFHAGERVHWLTAQLEAGGVTVIGLLLTSTALGVLKSLVPDAGVPTQVALVVTVTGLVGLMRFIALRWLFRPRATTTA